MKVQAQPHWRWRVSLERKEKRGSIQDCLCLYRWGEPEKGRMGVLQNNECWWFSQSPTLPSSSHPLKADYCSAELFTLMGSAVGVFFDDEPHANRILLAWPFPVSDTVLVGQDRRCAAVTSISNGKQNVWRCSVRGAVAGQRWRLKLGMRVSHACCYSGTTILPSSVILVWAEWSAPSKKLRTGCQGQEGV